MPVQTKEFKAARFRPGQSGNPKGRPATPADVRDALRAKTPEAVELLWKLCNHKDAEIRLRAVTAWLKKTVPDLSSVSVDVDGGLSVEVSASAEEALAKLERLAASVATGATDGPKPG